MRSNQEIRDIEELETKLITAQINLAQLTMSQVHLLRLIAAIILDHGGKLTVSDINRRKSPIQPEIVEHYNIGENTTTVTIKP